MSKKIIAINKTEQVDIEVEISNKEIVIVNGIVMSQKKFFREYILKDGKYLTNHIYHPVDSRKRIVEVKNGIVHCQKHSFSLSHFFEVNYIVEKVDLKDSA